jgi:LysM repeat protein
LLAPVVWAMRGDGEKISGTQSGGAAAIVQMDPSTDASEATDLTNSPTTSLSVIITAAATLAPTTTTEPTARVCAQKYIVQPGDSWYGIAAEAGVSASLIAGSNNTTIQAPLSPGQELEHVIMWSRVHRAIRRLVVRHRITRWREGWTSCQSQWQDACLTVEGRSGAVSTPRCAPTFCGHHYSATRIEFGHVVDE